nr:hypothetical protein [Tanacetum cinerariifolium]
MTYPAASLTLDNAMSYVMQGAPFTQGMISSIPIGGNISLEGLLLILLVVVVVIIVTVFIVAVILVIVIVAIVGVVIVVTIIGVVVVIGVFAIIKLSFVIIGFEAVTFPSLLLGNPSMKTSISFLEFGTIVGHKIANSWDILIPSDLVRFLYSNRFGIGIPPGQGILGESTSSKFHFAFLGTVATRKYRFSSFKPINETNSSFCTIEVERLAAHKLIKILESKTFRDGYRDNGMRDLIEGLMSLGSSRSGSPPRGRVNLTGDENPIDEDGDTEVGDSEVSVSLGEIFLGGRKSQESNIGDSDNTGDEGKIVGGSIGSCSGGIGESDSEAKRSLVKSSKKLEEVFLGEAEK